MINILSKILSKIKTNSKSISESQNANHFNELLVSYKIRPKIKDIFTDQNALKSHLDGYSEEVLNEYIVAKSRLWLNGLNIDNFIFPPHVYSLLWIIQLVQARLDRPIRIIDFGGGAPTLPILLNQLGLSNRIDSYKIIESPAFVRKIPQEWKSTCSYSDVYCSDKCDLLILSSVLPYLSKSLVKSVYENIEKEPPRFIYFGRTSFLSASYQADEAFTVQESKFREHGAQIDVGMADVEENIAKYVKRHFKWSEIDKVIGPLGYMRILSLADDSGLENIKGLGLYSNNSLWERNE